ncbi:phytanoyl-CoA dioxygenase-like isoform X2 [Acanthaster planci]|uniref:Phytanoyl-CoA dioxygenase-like isoform X2 n=1 Tax=Acanthaster planci TaxID=133434 RepID=A0A8B7YPR8_ACAPL|nr:phytanoyl-CoA dioxygenase-like isoform X2 [Acanthaster planci]
MPMNTRKRSSQLGDLPEEKRSKHGKEPCVAEPELYTTIPPQPKAKKPGQLTHDQLKRYFDEGYLLIPDFFQPFELDPVREGIAEEVDRLVDQLYNAGKIKDKCSDAGLFQRMTLIEEQFPGAAVLLHKTGYLPQSFRDLWSNERLLNVMEQLIGPDIAGHPVWNLRVKTPQNEQATVPWHQDNAYLDPEALHVLQPTAWIPMLDVQKENGCLQVIPRGHRKGVTATHTCCVGGTWYVQIKDTSDMMTSLGVDVKDAVTVEMPYGGVLLMNNAIPHQSLENYSDKIRWSLDLRWQRPDKPNGFYGIKDSVLMRTSKDPNYTIDFESFNKVDRHIKAVDSMLGTEKELGVSRDTKADDEFDTTIMGPWMKRWELVHHNRHTAKFERNEDRDDATSSWHSWDKA